MTTGEFHTATMAKVYAQQGHYRKAADIYRYILTREPDREDIIAELSIVEKQLTELEPESKPDCGDKDLVCLFHKWFQMAAGHDRIEHLQKLKRQMSTQK